MAKNAFSITLASQGCRNKLPKAPCLKCNTNELNTVLEVKSPNGGSLGCQQGDIPFWRLWGAGGIPCLMVSSPIFKAAMMGFPGGAGVENLPANAGDTGSSPGLGGSHMPQSN